MIRATRPSRKRDSTIPLINVVFLMLMSAPLVASAIALAGAPWVNLGWVLLLLLVPAVTWYVGGALLYALAGENAMFTYPTARIAFGAVYFLTGWGLPDLSAVRLPYALLASGSADAGDVAWFVAVHATALVLGAIGLGFALARLRRQASANNL